jgi:hypothetical protein
MAVEWNRGAAAQHEPLIADRHLYLDKTGNTVVEEGDANSASQLVAAGHPIDPADAGRLGLVLKDGRVVQDRAVKIEEHQRLVDELQGEKDALYASIDQYRAENASKDIPNTMEAARVALETRYEHAKLALSQFIKAHAGKDPLKGESQATALEPEKSDVANEATARANAASPRRQRRHSSRRIRRRRRAKSHRSIRTRHRARTRPTRRRSPRPSRGTGNRGCRFSSRLRSSRPI